MDVSLDEYIARNKSVGNWKAIQGKSERKFKAERHEQSSDDDDDESIFEANDIGKCSYSGKNYIDLDMPDEENDQATLKNPGFDLRNKITGTEEVTEGDVPKANSQQWRIMRPNVLNQRPAGMPPLVPQSAVEEYRSQNGLKKKIPAHRNNNRKKFYNKTGRNNANKNGNCINWAFKGYVNGNNNNRRFNNNGSNINSGYNYNRNNNNNGHNNNLHNNNNLYNSSGSNNNGFCNNLNPYNNNNNNCTNGYMKGGNKNVVNLKTLKEQHVNQRSSEFVTSEVHDLTIECPAESIELFPTNSIAERSLMVAPGKESMQNSEDNSYRQNNSLRALLNINNPQYQASKALEILQSIVEQPKHKPLYDLKIQKEIHAIQKKTLLYKCPGGDVISSDGNGINCEIIPRTSGVSLNHRFA